MTEWLIIVWMSADARNLVGLGRALGVVVWLVSSPDWLFALLNGAFKQDWSTSVLVFLLLPFHKYNDSKL